MSKKQNQSKKLHAIELLASGSTHEQTAQQVGVCRPTVTNWLNDDPTFAKAVEDRRDELMQEYRGSLRSLVPLAIKELERIAKGNNAAAAIKAIDLILKNSGVVAPEAEEKALPSEIEIKFDPTGDAAAEDQ